MNLNSSLDDLSPAEKKALIERATSARAARMAYARTDANTFNEWVLRDQETGRSLVQAAVHEAWQTIIDNHDRIVLVSAFGIGKTQQIAVGRTLFQIANDRSIRGAIVSAAEGSAARSVRSVKEYIEKSESLRELYPDLLPSSPWTDSAFTVQRPIISNDPTLMAFGMDSETTLGSRWDWAVFDDIMTFANTRTPGERQKYIDWFDSTSYTRLSKRSKAIVLANAFHPSDLVHTLKARPGWLFVRTPILKPDGTSVWPEEYPLERIAKIKSEMHPLEFARKMLCMARDDAASRCQKEWLDAAVRRGAGIDLAPHGPTHVPPGCRIYTGVDLSIGESKKSDLTSIFTQMVYPNGDHELLWIESGRWQGPEIVERIARTQERMGSIVRVESNAAQKFILHFAHSLTTATVQSHTTTAKKWDPEYGVEAIFTQLSSGRWIIPSRHGIHPEVQSWMDECLYFSNATHTGDRLMAAYLSNEAVRQGHSQVGFVKNPGW